MSFQRKTLRLEWCSHAAAKYACEQWHYSRGLPTPPIVKIGVWEDAKYIGCVLFSRGNARNIGSPFGLQQNQVCELTRVALSKHTHPVSKIVALSIRMLRKQSPNMRLIVSFADPEHGHNGSIYQAMNWIYIGTNSGAVEYADSVGKRYHSRMVSATGWKKVYGKQRRVPRADSLTKIKTQGKHKYLMALDDEMREQIEPLRKPYPKRPKQATTSVQEARGGAAPTRTLQTIHEAHDAP